jgi:predicted patatin/cPLA2 family phospholipase
MPVTGNVPIAAAPANRRALILPGGGMRVAYQAGAVKALHDHGLRFSFGDGASGGTMNLAALLSGVAPDDLCSRWRTLNVTRFVSPRPLRTYLRFPAIGAFGDFDGIKDFVFPHLGIDIDRIRSARGIAGTFNVCEFDSKTVVPFPNADLSLPLLLAGVSLPMVTPAVPLNGRTYTDAVWIKDCNLMATVRQGANELWLIWCIGNTPRYKNGLLEQYVHMIEMSALGALHAEFAEIAALNERIKSGERPYGHGAPIVVHLVRPEFPLPLDPDYLMGRIDGATLVDSGYRDASRYLAAMSQAGVALVPAATAMTEPGEGVTFREVMTGRLTFGTGDPRAGYRDPAAIPFSLRASIDVRATKGFVADPDHRGDLTGELYSPRAGGTLPASRGEFRLFSPAGDGQTSEMVYELGYRRDGRPYWFRGRKHVAIAAPWKLWRATTTLYVTLHDGPDETAPVIAAGILRLGVFDLLALLGTLHATGCETLGRRLKSVFGFFGFFTRQLWRIYVLRKVAA